MKYTDTAPAVGDRVDAEVWYNATRFEGNTLKSGKTYQIPNLPQILYSPSGNDGFAVTDAAGSSMGFRWETRFGTTEQVQDSIGLDQTHVRQKLNDSEPLLQIDYPGDYNFPIPPSHSSDVGFYWEEVAPVNDSLTLTAGARLDLISMTADNNVAGVPFSVEDYFEVDSLDRDFYLWSLFLSAEQKLNDNWTATLGTGHGQRPPTLTELYAMSSSSAVCSEG